jgi:hypothetical protein
MFSKFVRVAFAIILASLFVFTSTASADEELVTVGLIPSVAKTGESVALAGRFYYLGNQEPGKTEFSITTPNGIAVDNSTGHLDFNGGPGSEYVVGTISHLKSQKEGNFTVVFSWTTTTSSGIIVDSGSKNLALIVFNGKVFLPTVSK